VTTEGRHVGIGVDGVDRHGAALSVCM
jgi:hypothetical protein